MKKSLSAIANKLQCIISECRSQWNVKKLLVDHNQMGIINDFEVILDIILKIKEVIDNDVMDQLYLNAIEEYCISVIVKLNIEFSDLLKKVVHDTDLKKFFWKKQRQLGFVLSKMESFNGHYCSWNSAMQERRVKKERQPSCVVSIKCEGKDEVFGIFSRHLIEILSGSVVIMFPDSKIPGCLIKFDSFASLLNVFYSRAPHSSLSLSPEIRQLLSPAEDDLLQKTILAAQSSRIEVCMHVCILIQ